MKMVQENYPILLNKQESLTNGATLTSDVLDCKGGAGGPFDYVRILIHSTTSNNATNVPTVLSVQEADVTNASSFANIVNFTGGTAVDATHGFVIPNMPTATTGSPYAVFYINLIRRKRYLRTLISPVTTQTFSVLADLSSPEQSLDTPAPTNTANLPTNLHSQNAAVAVYG